MSKTNFYEWGIETKIHVKARRKDRVTLCWQKLKRTDLSIGQFINYYKRKKNREAMCGVCRKNCWQL